MESIYRQFEGYGADFESGGVPYRDAEYLLGDRIRGPCKLSIHVDANSILLAWRHKPGEGWREEKAKVEGLVGPLKCFSKAETKPKGGWRNAVVRFNKPEHALLALKDFNGFQYEATTIYSIYYTVAQDVFQAVQQDVEGVLFQADSLHFRWEEPKSDKARVLRVAGTERVSLADVKRVLDAIFWGRIAVDANRGDIWHGFFAGTEGKVWLRHLCREAAREGCSTLIVVDSKQRRLRIYGGNDEHLGAIEAKLVQKVSEYLPKPKGVQTLDLGTTLLKKLMASDTVSELRRILGPNKVNVNIIAKTLILECDLNLAKALAERFSLPPPLTAEDRPEQDCLACGESTSDIRLSCGHVFCKVCFQHQIKSASTDADLTAKHFPVLCWPESCKTPISIPDLRQNTTSSAFDGLLKASLVRHFRSKPTQYRSCRTPDCSGFYSVNSPEELYSCQSCLALTCTLCHKEPHIGFTCEAYANHVAQDSIHEAQIDDYMAQNANTKKCPDCAMLIEKIDGCNHVECIACQTHLCWDCMKPFSSSGGVYAHMQEEGHDFGGDVAAGFGGWEEDEWDVPPQNQDGGDGLVVQW